MAGDRRAEQTRPGLGLRLGLSPHSAATHLAQLHYVGLSLRGMWESSVLCPRCAQLPSWQMTGLCFPTPFINKGPRPLWPAKPGHTW